MKKILLRILPRLLPAGALFLPLGSLTISLGALFERPTSYNLVGLLKTFGGKGNELFLNLLKSEAMAPAVPWLVLSIVGLVLGVLAVLAGLALSWRGSIKLYAASAAVYAGGTLGIALAAAAFPLFGKILVEAVSLASTALGYGVWILLALLLLNAAVCFFQWRAEKEQARLAALAKRQKQKRKR
ncbi:MAG: hypothetical protein FWC27_00130 [Firmicutes bacterium]|nr:hypothetical protein [Bacillota bacterium]